MKLPTFITINRRLVETVVIIVFAFINIAIIVDCIETKHSFLKTLIDFSQIMAGVAAMITAYAALKGVNAWQEQIKLPSQYMLLVECKNKILALFDETNRMLDSTFAYGYEVDSVYIRNHEGDKLIRNNIEECRSLHNQITVHFSSANLKLDCDLFVSKLLNFEIIAKGYLTTIQAKNPEMVQYYKESTSEDQTLDEYDINKENDRRVKYWKRKDCLSNSKTNLFVALDKLELLLK